MKCGIKEFPAAYRPPSGSNAGDTTIKVKNTWNFVVENHGTTVVMLNNIIDLQPAGNTNSIRVFTGNNCDKYSQDMSITWAKNAQSTDYILVIATMDDES